MDIHKALLPVFSYFRARRMREFVQLLEIGGETRILDVGGTLLNWSLVPVRPQLTILNKKNESVGFGENVSWLFGDGRSLPFKDQSYDVVYSNSVIEHLGNLANQQAFAKEIMRVGKRYYVQSPARWFPVESHLLTPFIHFLPKSLQQKLIRNFTLWGLFSRPPQEICNRFILETRLLNYKDIKQLFPHAQILRERVLGMTKSFIVLGKTD